MRPNPINTILEYFSELDWDHRFYPEDSSVDASYTGENGSWQCRAVWDQQAEIFCFYSFLPTSVPAERRWGMMELITRLNLGQRYGDFELDLATGSLALRTYLLCREHGLDSQAINDAVSGNLALMDDHLHILMKLIYSDISPMEAWEEAVQEENARFGPDGEDDAEDEDEER
ncbi:MAG: YbjN domain-containing protein [bacterium]|jgi:hypothetical protein|nr:YbjN domain-containing protein [bacterium]